MSIGTIEALPAADLHAHVSNPRIDYGDRKGLTASIAQHGIIQPITVTADPAGGYTILAGHRRHASATDAGLTDVPCIIVDTTDAKAAATMVHENVHRDGLTTAELARGVQGMLDAGVSVKDTAKGLHIAQQEVKDLRAANAAPEDSRAHLHTGKISLDGALTLAEINDTHPAIYAEMLSALDKGENASWTLAQGLKKRGLTIATAQVEALAKERDAQTLASQPYGWDGTANRLDEGQAVAHQGRACYGLYATCTHDGEPVVEHWCTSTKSHRTDKAEATVEHTEAERAARKRVIANNKAWHAANESRTTWAKEALTANFAVPKKVAPLMILANLLRAYVAADVHAGHIQATKQKEGTHISNAEAATQLASEAVANRVHLFAIIACYEKSVDKSVWRQSYNSAGTAAYLTLVSALGYPLTPPEKHLLAQVGADKPVEDTDYPM